MRRLLMPRYLGWGCELVVAPPAAGAGPRPGSGATAGPGAGAAVTAVVPLVLAGGGRV